MSIDVNQYNINLGDKPSKWTKKQRTRNEKLVKAYNGSIDFGAASRLQSIRDRNNSSVYITLNSSLERKLKSKISFVNHLIEVPQSRESKINPLNLTFDLRNELSKGSNSNQFEKSVERPSERGKCLSFERFFMFKFRGDKRGIKTDQF